MSEGDDVIGSVLAELKSDLVKVKTLKNLMEMITSELGLFTEDAQGEKCENPIPHLRETMEKESEVYLR